ncbi:solute carrier family 28 member 3-like [Haliotis rubra]|uniref:solute carrier family 28 member 3-like n=1 Tax=Haliotis rubra TaxID=36100 RepID=UPI001EE50432|nr:solute carrier family 28 member 3-like [Haliotis rubra]
MTWFCFVTGSAILKMSAENGLLKENCGAFALVESGKSDVDKEDFEEHGLLTHLNDLSVEEEEREEEREDEEEFREYYLKCGGRVAQTRTAIVHKLNEHKTIIGRVVGSVILVVYLVYLGFCIDYSFGDEGSVRLVWGTCFVLFLVGYSNFSGKIFQKIREGCRCQTLRRPIVRKGIRWFLYLSILLFIITYLCLTILQTSPKNFTSLAGLVFFIVIGYIFSKRPDLVNWHAVFWGITTQFLFALFILRSRFGYSVFNWLGERLEEYMRHTDKGSQFVFGDSFRDHQFVFVTMPLIIFMSSTVNMLYHYGVLQAIVKNFGKFLFFCMGTSAVESVNAAFNMFLGPSEAPMAIKPFLPLLTASEMHAIMVATFSSISGSVFGMLVNFGAPANHLLTASVMSAPAALAMAKLTMPETRRTRVKPEDAYNITMAKFQSVLEAISIGAVDGITLASTVVVNQIVFIAAIEFIDTAFQWFGHRVGVKGVTFSLLCSYMFYPLAYIMGFPKVDLFKIGELMGIKIFANSFVGFMEFGRLVINRKDLEQYQLVHNGTWHWQDGNVILDATNVTLVGGILEKRSEVLGTYALCGLNHIGAVGVAMGTLIALCPERRTTITKYVLRANITGQMACFMTACIAGLLYDEALQSA